MASLQSSIFRQDEEQDYARVCAESTEGLDGTELWPSEPAVVVVVEAIGTGCVFVCVFVCSTIEACPPLLMSDFLAL